MEWNEKERNRNGEGRHSRKPDLHELIGTIITTFLTKCKEHSLTQGWDGKMCTKGSKFYMSC